MPLVFILQHVRPPPPPHAGVVWPALCWLGPLGCFGRTGRTGRTGPARTGCPALYYWSGSSCMWLRLRWQALRGRLEGCSLQPRLVAGVHRVACIFVQRGGVTGGVHREQRGDRVETCRIEAQVTKKRRALGRGGRVVAGESNAYCSFG